MTLSKYFSLAYYFNQFGYTKASSLTITKDQPLTDESIERINIDFARKTREAVRWMNANGTDIPALVNSDIAGIIGAGVNIQSRIKDEPDLNTEIEEFLDEWGEDCVTDGRFHLNSALRTMVATNKKDGGFIIKHHFNLKWDIPYKFEMIEVGMIDFQHDDEKKNVLNGLKKDKYGAITGIYIFKDQERQKSTLIPYDELIFFSPVWISLSQYTAVSKFASVLPTIDQMDRFTDAELNKVISDAKQGRFWRTTLYDDILKLVASIKDTSKRELRLTEIMQSLQDTGIKSEGLTAIPHGDDIVKTENLSASIYPNIMKDSKQDVSSGSGLPSAIVYKDAGDANYSSLKMGLELAKIHWSVDYDDLYARVIKPILKIAIRTGVDIQQLKIADYYLNPRKYYKLEIMRLTNIDIEPTKTAQADEKKLSNGTTSKRAIARREGRDYRDVLEEILDDELLEIDLRKEKGLTPKEEDPIDDGEEDDIKN